MFLFLILMFLLFIAAEGVEVFPENVAAAQLVYQCLGACPGDGSRFQADVTASSTSDDGDYSFESSYCILNV